MTPVKDIDWTDISFDASALFEVIDHLQNSLNDSDRVCTLTHLATKLSLELDNKIRNAIGSDPRK